MACEGVHQQLSVSPGAGLRTPRNEERRTPPRWGEQTPVWVVNFSMVLEGPPPAALEGSRIGTLAGAGAGAGLDDVLRK